MQFSRVLAFATLAIASPTPAILENRDASVSFSDSISQYFNDLANSVNNAVSANAKNALQLTGVIATTTDATVQATQQQVLTAITTIVDAVKPVESAALSSLKDVVTAAASGGNLVLNDLTTVQKAVDNLIASLTSADLQSILQLTVSATATGTAGAIRGEVQALKNLVNPIINKVANTVNTFAGPLTELQAKVQAAAKVNPTPVTKVLDAFTAFFVQIAALLLTVQQ